jgi:uncharacterized membrane protein required for colicin V production
MATTPRSYQSTAQICDHKSHALARISWYGRDVGATLAAVDTTVGQIAADVLLLALVAANGVFGWRWGLLRRILAFAGLYVGVFAASNIGNGIAGIISPHSVYADAWCFIAVLVLVVATSEVLGHIFADRLQKLIVFIFDRAAGVVGGVIVGVAEALALFLVAFSVAAVPNSTTGTADNAAAANAVKSAMLAGPVSNLESQFKAVFAPVLPSSLAAHLSENTPTALPPTG